MPSEKKTKAAPDTKIERALAFAKTENVSFPSDDTVIVDGTVILKNVIDNRLNHFGDQIWESLSYNPDVEHSMIHGELKFEVKVTLKGEIEVLQRELEL